MGQIADYLTGQVLIARGSFPQLATCLRNMCSSDEKVHLGSNVCKLVISSLDNNRLYDAFDALGLTLDYDIYGNIRNITVEPDEFDQSYEHIVLPAIAAVVLDGSYMQMANSDGSEIKYTFLDGICTIESSTNLFPSTDMFVVVKHIYSDYPMGPDVQICGVYPDMQQAKKCFKNTCSGLRQYIRNNANHFAGDVEMVETDTTFTLHEGKYHNTHPIADAVIHKANGLMPKEDTND